MTTDPLLAVHDLEIGFPSRKGCGHAVSGISYELARGKTLGVVGESGCGKSMTALALLGLVPGPGVARGSIRFDGAELIGQTEVAWRRLRGSRIAMIFQEPMRALNPVMTIGRQIAETMVLHERLSWRVATDRAIALLDQVGIAAPRERAEAYPHQLSGGMRQRAIIAMAIACRPTLLIADEPTTALDVSIQAQILDLLLRLRDETGMAIQFISHNLAVVSEIADDIIVMYAGRIVERAPAERLFADPHHPYTRGLIATLPDPDRRVDRLPVIQGSVPAPDASIVGCRFADRCELADARCQVQEPRETQAGTRHFVACFNAQ